MSFKILQGDFVRVTGVSGAGKSTLLRLCIALELPSSGIIEFQGRNIRTLSPEELRKRVVYVQQVPTVVSGSVLENVLLPFSFRAHREDTVPSRQDIEEGLEKLLLYGLSPDDDAEGLSVGQKQRLCFLRTLLTRPDVLLLDEPESALDEESRDVLHRAVDEFHVQGGTVLWVSHLPFEGRMNHKTFEIRDGKVVVS